MSQQMQGKICVITGGAGSIGMAAAKLLLAEGAKVMLVDLSDSALDKAADAMGMAPGVPNLACCAADVTKSDQVRNCSSFTTESLLMVDGGLSA